MAPHHINRYGFLVLALSVVMEQLNAASVLPVGPNFLERVCAQPTRIQEVVTHGLRHGATSALATPPTFRHGLACGGSGATGAAGL